jgi:hypothetical protein
LNKELPADFMARLRHPKPFLLALSPVARKLKVDAPKQDQGGGRRSVLTAKPDGKIVWFSPQEYDAARTRLAVEKAVAAETKWK